MNISPKVKKGLIVGALCVGAFVLFRAAFGGASSAGGGASELPKPPTGPANFTGAITETTFGDITNPGMQYAYQGGAMNVEGDTRYLDYNTWMRGGDSAVLVDYSSPNYGDYIVNQVAPVNTPKNPCCTGK